MPITGTELADISTDTSTGSGDHGKIVLLNASGLVDDSMLPPAASGDITGVTAGTGLTGGGTSGGVTLAADFGSGAGKVTQGNDSRLSDSRTPTAHAASHKAGGTDQIRLDEFAATTDVTTLNSTTTAHGLLPKLTGDTSQYLNGNGAFVKPSQQTWYFFFDEESIHDVGQVDGDLAIITGPPPGNGKIYLYDETSWVVIGHIQSPTATGVWTSGTGAASGGNDGDYYLRTTTGEISLKTSGVWSVIFTIPTSGGGDITGVAAGTGLTGGGTSGDVTIAVAYGTTGTTACVGNDSRLSDSRTPTSHATSHKSGGTDSIKLDELAAPTDVTTLNVSTSAHGLTPKLPNDSTKFLDGTGTWSVPAGGGGGGGSGSAVGPYWDAPASGHADNDEFTTDTLSSGGWTIVPMSGGTALTRAGDVDPWTTPASGTFRSTPVAGQVLVQLPPNASWFIYKALTSPAQQSEIFWIGLSRNNAFGTTDISSRLMLTKASGGNIDWNNTLRTGMWGGNPPTFGMALLQGGSSTGFVTGSGSPTNESSIESSIIGARCDAGSGPAWQSFVATPFSSVLRTGIFTGSWNTVSYAGFQFDVPSSPLFGGIVGLSFFRRAVGATKWMHG